MLSRLNLHGLLATTIFLWLAMLALQSVVGPWDGYVPAYVHHEGALVALGPMLHRHFAPFFMTEVPATVVRLLYVTLLLLACAVSAVFVARLLRTDSRERSAFWPWLIALVVLLAGLSFVNLPYLSNDLYLYRTYGEMLERGLNPYFEIPSRHFPAPALEGIPWTRQTSAYGPAALLLFRTSSALTTGPVAGFWVLKTLLVLPWTIVLWIAATRGGESQNRFATFAWLGLNPLILLEVAQNGHLEGWTASLLLGTVLLLRDHAPAKAAAAGVCVGVLGAFKLSQLVVVGPVLAGLLAVGPRERPSRERWAAAVVFGVAALVTLMVFYLPFWRGPGTFDGLRTESEKILRSVYFLLSRGFDLPVRVLMALSLAGMIAAVGVGSWARVRGLPLEVALIITLVLQAVVGRTFLHSWYMVPPLVLMGLVQSEDGRRRHELKARTRLGIVDEGLWLVVSVSALIGAYAIAVVAQNLGTAVQTASVLVMLVPPLALAVHVDRQRARAFAKGGNGDRAPW